MKQHKKKEWLLYITGPAAFIAALLLSWQFAGKNYGRYWLKQWNAMVIQGAPVYQYEQQMDAPYSGQMKNPASGEQIGEITCEAAGLRTPLYYGDSEKVLAKGAGIYTGGYLPGESGTVLAGAHDTTFFAPLEKVKEGDVLNVITGYGKFSYRVEQITAADMKEKDMYKISKKDGELILYTCYPFGSLDEKRDQRYYVYAREIEKDSGD